MKPSTHCMCHTIPSPPPCSPAATRGAARLADFEATGPLRTFCKGGLLMRFPADPRSNPRAMTSELAPTAHPRAPSRASLLSERAGEPEGPHTRPLIIQRGHGTRQSPTLDPTQTREAADSLPHHPPPTLVRSSRDRMLERGIRNGQSMQNAQGRAPAQSPRNPSHDLGPRLSENWTPHGRTEGGRDDRGPLSTFASPLRVAWPGT